jgi:3-oxoacyl-[acyl-carrier protein] reductase
MTNLAGRVAMVTGASRGLGRVIAVALARSGAYVVVGYRSRRDDAEATLQEMVGVGGRGETAVVDVCNREIVGEVVADVVSRHQAVHVLVNNAGITRDTLFATMSPQEWDEVLAVNLTGIFNCCRAVMRPMMVQRDGVIVNIASVAGLHASVGQANYAASKGGVLALTRTLASELAPRGIRVNAVVPGLLQTGMVARLDHQIVQEKKEMIPLGRLGKAEEIAEGVLFLASDAASYMTGQALVIDGGLTL